MKAFTMIELLVVVVTIALLAVLLLPRLARPKVHVARVKCISNLKQVGLSFRIFAGDNNDRFPFEATNTVAFNNTNSAWMHFQVMSDDLASAKILMCPKDSRRLNFAASDFSTNTIGLMSPGKQDLSISYFVGLGADETKPQTVLTGDRNLARAESAACYSSFAQGGAIQISATSAWSSSMMHGAQGNIVLGDASVQQVDSKWLSARLQAATNLYGITNNYFLFPQ